MFTRKQVDNKVVFKHNLFLARLSIFALGLFLLFSNFFSLNKEVEFNIWEWLFVGILLIAPFFKRKNAKKITFDLNQRKIEVKELDKKIVTFNFNSTEVVILGSAKHGISNRHYFYISIILLNKKTKSKYTLIRCRRYFFVRSLLKFLGELHKKNLLRIKEGKSFAVGKIDFSFHLSFLAVLIIIPIIILIILVSILMEKSGLFVSWITTDNLTIFILLLFLGAGLYPIYKTIINPRKKGHKNPTFYDLIKKQNKKKED